MTKLTTDQKRFIREIHRRDMTQFREEICSKLGIQKDRFYKLTNFEDPKIKDEEKFLERTGVKWSPALTTAFLRYELKEFPYPIRENQETAIRESLKHLRKHGQHVYWDFHTGFGKTIVALYVVWKYVQALKSKKKFKILYFCRTKEQTNQVIDELNVLGKMKGIVLRSRKEMCFDEEIKESDDSLFNVTECYAKQRSKECFYFHHYKFGSKPRFFNAKLNEVIEVCEEEEKCPYYCNLSHIGEANIIITCYATLFNHVTRRVLFRRLKGFRLIIIFDEAHNLIDLDSPIDAMKIKILKKSLEKFEDEDEILKTIHGILAEFQKNREETLLEKLDLEISRDEKRDLMLEILSNTKLNKEELLEKLMELENKFIQARHFARYKFAHFCRRFVKYFNDFKYFFSLELSDMGETFFSILYLRKDRFFRRFLLYRVICMSGTLDLAHFCDTLKLKESKHILKLPVPWAFPIENQKEIVMDGMSTYYKERNENTFEKYARLIQKVLKMTEKNVGVFFTSYVMLDQIVDLEIDRKENNRRIKFKIETDREIFRENRKIEVKGKKMTIRLSAVENAEMIEKFREKNGKSKVLFGVIGGRNSEGVNFRGEEMEIIMIIGLPFPKLTPLKIAYLRVYKDLGREIVFDRPVVLKVRQVLGRIFRSEEDRGIVLICDSRFWKKEEIVSLLPDHLKDFQIVRYNHFKRLKRIFHEFFNSKLKKNGGLIK